jgi:hypothetical protein
MKRRAYSVNEWISVEDRLPIQDCEGRLPIRDCKVIVYVQKVRGGFMRKERFVTTAVFCMTMIDKHYFDFQGNDAGIVTHWMPIPEPPKEKEN